jgi:chromosome segregation ATPase|tara:strand:+ start:533 stop:739 length:207 start_codon:yes stop_codon:yes gene_type:complete
MWKLTKTYFADVWELLWSKTSIDEKAIETIKEIKRRYNLTTKELSDVADAIKKVGKEISDIDNAIKGK